MILPDPPAILAPMAGYTHPFFRRFIRHLGGVGLVSGEFISSEALSRGHSPSQRRLKIHTEEHPVSIQIFGFDSQRMAESAALAEDAGADLIDINAGCPARKIMRSGSGAALLANPDKVKQIVRAVVGRVSVPVTLKLRLGITADCLPYLDIARIAEDHGIQAITLHPRTAEQGYRGEADWGRITTLKETVSLPVWGNGDIQNARDAVHMFAMTGCDAVMIGRGALRNPWIFKELKQVRSGGFLQVLPVQEKLRYLASWLDHEEVPFRLSLPLLIQASHGFSGSRFLRSRLNAVLSGHRPAPLLPLMHALLRDIDSPTANHKTPP